jgi:hypothetical protein
MRLHSHLQYIGKDVDLDNDDIVLACLAIDCTLPVANIHGKWQELPLDFAKMRKEGNWPLQSQMPARKGENSMNTYGNVRILKSICWHEMTKEHELVPIPKVEVTIKSNWGELTMVVSPAAAADYPLGKTFEIQLIPIEDTPE